MFRYMFIVLFIFLVAFFTVALQRLRDHLVGR